MKSTDLGRAILVTLAVRHLVHICKDYAILFFPSVSHSAAGHQPELVHRGRHQDTFAEMLPICCATDHFLAALGVVCTSFDKDCTAGFGHRLTKPSSRHISAVDGVKAIAFTTLKHTSVSKLSQWSVFFHSFNKWNKLCCCKYFNFSTCGEGGGEGNRRLWLQTQIRTSVQQANPAVNERCSQQRLWLPSTRQRPFKPSQRANNLPDAMQKLAEQDTVIEGRLKLNWDTCSVESLAHHSFPHARLPRNQSLLGAIYCCYS